MGLSRGKPQPKQSQLHRSRKCEMLQCTGRDCVVDTWGEWGSCAADGMAAKAEIVEGFKVFDTDNSGYLSVDEVIAILVRPRARRAARACVCASSARCEKRRCPAR